MLFSECHLTQHYFKVAEYAFLIGPKALRRFSKVSRYVVLSALVATQIGGCCVYFLFISTNLQKVNFERILRPSV